MTNNDLRENIRNFRIQLGQEKGLTAMQKKLACEALLHDLREDALGPKTLREQESKDFRRFLRFVLHHAEEALARQRGP